METIILEIRAGEGGSDSQLLVSDITQYYIKSIKKNNFKLDDIDETNGSSLLIITGKGVQKYFINEIGIHTFQRVPPTERNGRLHTSIITVAVMNPQSQTNYQIKSCDIDTYYTRGSGNGGQHRNTTNSCVVLRHKPSGIQIRIDGRCQHQNEKLAYYKLQIKLNELQQKKQQEQDTQFRHEQIGFGKRGNKKRTYRIKDNLVIDHITNKRTTFTNIEKGSFNLLHE